MVEIQELFEAIKNNQADIVRQYVLQDKSLLQQKYKSPDAKFDAEVELDAYKFLGAYLGSLTPLQFAILMGVDEIAKDLIERSFKGDLDETFGGGNTALHLGTLLGATGIVQLLIERGASTNANNSKGFAPVDLSDDSELRKLFNKA